MQARGRQVVPQRKGNLRYKEGRLSWDNNGGGGGCMVLADPPLIIFTATDKQNIWFGKKRMVSRRK